MNQAVWQNTEIRVTHGSTTGRCSGKGIPAAVLKLYATDEGTDV